jgi:hypothetical protein
MGPHREQRECNEVDTNTDIRLCSVNVGNKGAREDRSADLSHFSVTTPLRSRYTRRKIKKLTIGGGDPNCVSSCLEGRRADVSRFDYRTVRSLRKYPPIGSRPPAPHAQLLAVSAADGRPCDRSRRDMPLFAAAHDARRPDGALRRQSPMHPAGPWFAFRELQADAARESRVAAGIEPLPREIATQLCKVNSRLRRPFERLHT